MNTKSMVFILLLAICFAPNASAQLPGANQPLPAVAHFADVILSGANPFSGAAALPPSDPFWTTSWNQILAYPGSTVNTTPTAAAQPEEDLQPQNPVIKPFAGGKVIVIVGAKRHFGYRTGYRIRLSIILIAAKTAKFDFSSIERGVYGPDGSDFEQAAEPTIKALGEKEDKSVTTVELVLRSFVVKPALAFTADFMCAADNAPKSNIPNWKRFTTPKFVVTTSKTGDNGGNLPEGDTNNAPAPVSWATFPLMTTGATLLILGALVLPVMISRWRKIPDKQVPANEQAWLAFMQALDEGQRTGFTTSQYQLIAASLKQYLGVQAASLNQSLEQLHQHSKFAQIQSALTKLESALYDKGSLTAAQHQELFLELEAIVPKP